MEKEEDSRGVVLVYSKMANKKFPFFLNLGEDFRAVIDAVTQVNHTITCTFINALGLIRSGLLIAHYYKL